MRKPGTLQIALAASLGVHGALLSLRIAAPEAFNRIFQDTPLEVVLVNTRSNEAPVKAQALAQANLAGGGNLETGRATSPLPPARHSEVGDAAEAEALARGLLAAFEAPLDAGDLRGHDVHDDARRVDGLAAGHVEPHAAHRLPALHDARAGAKVGRDRRGHLGRGCRPHALDGTLERQAHDGVERGEGVVEVRCRDPDGVTGHAVEPLRLVAEGRLAVARDGRDDARGGRQRLVAGRGRARHRVEELGGGQGATPQVDGAQHPRISPA